MPWLFGDPIESIKRNDVVLYTYFDSGARLATDHWYALVMHEMGHVTHYLKSPINCALSIGIVGESWATAIEYYFTFNHYPDEVSGLIDQERGDIICCTDRSWKYTPFFIDLRDPTNQGTNNGGSTNWADDDVSGYTLHQMQMALDKRTTLSGVCAHLENNYSNASERNLDDLVEFYNDIKDNQ